MKKALPTILGLVCLVAFGFGANALIAARSAETRADEPGAASHPRALPVETIRLVPVDRIEVTRTFTGELAARRQADLAFEGNGRILEIMVDDGEDVTAGQALARLDSADLDARRAEVEAQRVRLQAQLDQLIAGPRKETILAASANVNAIREELRLAEVQRDRRKALAEKGTISSEQLDTTRALVNQLAARLAAAEAQLAELENGTRVETLAAQRGALLELDAALHTIDVSIGKTTLCAPFAGTIGARLLDEGAVVSQQMPSAAFRLVETRALEARIGIPAALATEVTDADATPSLTMGEHHLEVHAIRALPALAAGTRTVTVIFEIAPDSARAAHARPGDLVSLDWTTSRAEQGAWIPLGALSESARGLWSAFAIVPPSAGSESSTVARIELEVLTANESRAFVRGTFNDELTIVAKGSGRIVPGQAVRPIPASSNQ